MDLKYTAKYISRRKFSIKMQETRRIISRQKNSTQCKTEEVNILKPTAKSTLLWVISGMIWSACNLSYYEIYSYF